MSNFKALSFSTQAELNLVDQIRIDFASELSEHPESNLVWTILRFLRARGLNLVKTKKMLLNYFKFKKDINYKSIIDMDQQDFAIIKKGWIIGLCGYDYEGRVITIDRIDHDDAREIFQSTSRKMIEAYTIQRYERIINICLPIVSDIFQKRVDKILAIIDLGKFNLGQVWRNKMVDFLKIIASVGQDIFPEILGKSFIINAPLLFTGLWAIGKSMMDQKTVEKFEVLGTNWQKRVSKFVDIEKLPIFLGGKNDQPFDDTNGPWKEQMIDSYEKKTFYLPTDELYEKYFFCNQEKLCRILSQKKVKEKEEDKIELLTSENDVKVMKTFRVESFKERNSLNMRKSNVVKKVRVENYSGFISMRSLTGI